MLDPAVAAALILALGGVLFAACAILVVRQLRAPALDRARLDAVERALKSEMDRIERLVGESHKAATDARRMAASRKGKAERAEVEEPEPVAEQPRGPRVVFKPGCDPYGRPVSLAHSIEEGNGTADALAARGLRVVDGKLSEVG